MGQVIKVRCNGPNKDVNDVKLSDILRETPLARDYNASSEFPERIVLPCRFCTNGKVVITQAMLEDFFSK